MTSTLKKIIKLDGFSPSQKIAISFVVVIVLGAFALMLPISNVDGKYFSFIDALFMSTSATCVTGLAVVPPAIQFTTFGQVVLLLLIQIGGLGLMSMVASIALSIRKKLSIQNKLAMREMLNQTNMLDFRKFLFGIIRFTFVFEIIGTIILSFAFVPEYGLKGIYISIFTSISAFCNAGFDIIGSNSLVEYVNNPIVNFTVMILIIAGGLGFIVYFDLRDKFKDFFRGKLSFIRLKQRLMLQTKIVIVISAILIFIPALLIFIIEFNNPATLGNLGVDGKIYASLFSSVTLRTAGFATLDFAGFYPVSQFIMIICMFIGGSPGGTAGGIKTTTLAIILINVICNIRGQEKTSIFHRHISRDLIVRSTTILVINLGVLFLGIFGLLIVCDFDFITIIFEAVSALATVGLTLGITTLLPTIAKIIVVVLMYVGRIGILTFLVSIIRQETKKSVDYAEGNIMIG
ncbi:trk system potassium uptake protein TrkH [Breznakia sp. PF5-3]|uniref:TrkH family potassium uptake protein n=1 Tax=unclassified Breznakia TaxID=2623764 RepID=UPI00240738FE|nr:MULTISPECIES: TrkH family potassium uptake protein [unclassified Breznakia]MDF9824495.1 trk system potassium uptake protein TrkH [Breznakia sp. PM6-1]MDF9835281.1 trk system potassium uptake protein TrkH [Breznakia sp. PF5-3]MDF9836997.1 trk system potassium uptake protein TrkH [Breznakia sp. PFB2-8]MDF9858922.1 trk system potassium uptake protein TrkH [Breznakia sp. PH5-24]